MSQIFIELLSSNSDDVKTTTNYNKKSRAQEACASAASKTKLIWPLPQQVSHLFYGIFDRTMDIMKPTKTMSPPLTKKQKRKINIYIQSFARQFYRLCHHYCIDSVSFWHLTAYLTKYVHMYVHHSLIHKFTALCSGKFSYTYVILQDKRPILKKLNFKTFALLDSNFRNRSYFTKTS